MKDNYNSHTREWIMFAEIPNARTKIIFAPVSSGPMRKHIDPWSCTMTFLHSCQRFFNWQIWNSSSHVKRDNFYMEHLPVIRNTECTWKESLRRFDFYDYNSRFRPSFETSHQDQGHPEIDPWLSNKKFQVFECLGTFPSGSQQDLFLS